jgi:hypothetical protein
MASGASRFGRVARLTGRRLRRIDPVNAIVTAMLLAAVAALLAWPWVFLMIVAGLAAAVLLLAVPELIIPVAVVLGIVWLAS